MIQKRCSLRKLQSKTKPPLQTKSSSKNSSQSKDPHQLWSSSKRVKVQEYLHTIPTKQALPFSHLVFSNKLSKLDIFKHVCSCFLAISETQIRKQISTLISQQSIVLPPKKKQNQKTLFLDLDETLIHATLCPIVPNCGTVKFKVNGNMQTVFFNIRPYCFQFLSNLSKIFQIYIFTAAEAVYGEALTDFLNQNHKTISGCFSRRECIRTSNGLFVKDLRLVKNRELKDMVLLDNLVLSFGESVENGVPIVEFRDNMEDEELVGLEKYFVGISGDEDVRVRNRERWRLREIEGIRETIKGVFGEG